MKRIFNKGKRTIRRFGQKVSQEEMFILDDYERNLPKVLTTTETLELIMKNKSSICRYGDGEFDICNQENKLDPYQRPSDKLTSRLTEIILSPSCSKIIVCIPPFNSKYNNIKNYYGKLSFWQWYWLNKYSKIKPLLNKEIYGNSFVSRNAVFYENNLSTIKCLWDNRDVVFVYGRNGRFDIHSNLFNSIKKYSVIHVSPVNAFEEYDDILEKCIKFDKQSLFLIAAGPTATVLAYDLSSFGYQALDVGHLPNCYEQYLGHIVSPENLPLIKRK
ncbi:GT-D fold domain-containing protein [Clostridium sp. FP2]|uniref:GT-D fold domain-containing glycosyltransferase n=1 Tax=Clostridium sp. FP2 TaxID=2724481 RepID=UPI0013E8F6EB|nr:GT-D fold domain-containing glycosyltransferase [Clostridium sp. FP2]MBZ9625179.1 GT-D fold domain-containing protein [Clostridium sp. FP2]